MEGKIKKSNFYKKVYKRNPAPQLDKEIEVPLYWHSVYQKFYCQQCLEDILRDSESSIDESTEEEEEATKSGEDSKV